MLLAGVANEQINGGHAQHEREAYHALHSMREQGVSTNMAALWYKRLTSMLTTRESNWK